MEFCATSHHQLPHTVQVPSNIFRNYEHRTNYVLIHHGFSSIGSMDRSSEPLATPPQQNSNTHTLLGKWLSDLPIGVHECFAGNYSLPGGSNAKTHPPSYAKSNCSSMKSICSSIKSSHSTSRHAPSLLYSEATPTESSVSTGLASGFSGVPLLEELDGVLERRPNFCSSVFECPLWFLNCSYISNDKEEWKTHGLSHFRGEEPPKSVECPLCEDFKATFENGFDAWNARMDHVADCHCLLGHTLKLSRPDFTLFGHLWQKHLISDGDFKELRGGSHDLTRTRQPSVSSVRQRERGRRDRRVFFPQAVERANPVVIHNARVSPDLSSARTEDGIPLRRVGRLPINIVYGSSSPQAVSNRIPADSVNTAQETNHQPNILGNIIPSRITSYIEHPSVNGQDRINLSEPVASNMNDISQPSQVGSADSLRKSNASMEDIPSSAETPKLGSIFDTESPKETSASKCSDPHNNPEGTTSEASPDLATVKKEDTGDHLNDQYHCLSNCDFAINTCTGSTPSSSRQSAGHNQPSRPGQSGASRSHSNSVLRDSSKQDGNGGDDEPRQIPKNDRVTGPHVSKKLACPYFKHSPQKYHSLQSCPGPGWDTVHRVK